MKAEESKQSSKINPGILLIPVFLFSVGEQLQIQSSVPNLLLCKYFCLQRYHFYTKRAPSQIAFPRMQLYFHLDFDFEGISMIKRR
jgi:hypothetical protein